jgi:hypothetical protein
LVVILCDKNLDWVLLVFHLIFASVTVKLSPWKTVHFFRKQLLMHLHHSERAIEVIPNGRENEDQAETWCLEAIRQIPRCNCSLQTTIQ